MEGVGGKPVFQMSPQSSLETHTSPTSLTVSLIFVSGGKLLQVCQQEVVDSNDHIMYGFMSSVVFGQLANDPTPIVLSVCLPELPCLFVCLQKLTCWTECLSFLTRIFHTSHICRHHWAVISFHIQWPWPWLGVIKSAESKICEVHFLTLIPSGCKYEGVL